MTVLLMNPTRILPGHGYPLRGGGGGAGHQ